MLTVWKELKLGGGRCRCTCKNAIDICWLWNTSLPNMELSYFTLSDGEFLHGSGDKNYSRHNTRNVTRWQSHFLDMYQVSPFRPHKGLTRRRWRAVEENVFFPVNAFELVIPKVAGVLSCNLEMNILCMRGDESVCVCKYLHTSLGFRWEWWVSMWMFTLRSTWTHSRLCHTLVKEAWNACKCKINVRQMTNRTKKQHTHTHTNTI